MHPDTPVDLFPVVRQVVDGLQTLATDRGVEIAIAPPAAPAIVPGDRDELTRVFENLVENALKYGAAGKRVEIGFAAPTASDGAPEVLVAVRDYGPGIAAEHLPRLTERFYRVDVTQSRAEGGTGLGLVAGQAHPQPPPRQAHRRERGRQGRGVYRAAAADPQAGGRRFLEHDPLLWNRIMLWIPRIGRIFCGEPVSTPDQVGGRLSPENALGALPRPRAGCVIA